MKHEAMMKLMMILTDYGLSKREAIELISALLVQEAEEASKELNEQRSLTHLN